MAGILERFRAMFRPVVNVTFSGEESGPVADMDARRLYSTQSNLQTVISFIASNVAASPLKVYRRDGELERERDRDSVAARLLYKPNADQTSFEFLYATVVEYLVYGTVSWWILPDSQGDSGYQLRILPREWIIDAKSKTPFGPDAIRVCARDGGSAVDVPKSEFVMFRRYAPGRPGSYISPISALKQTISEQENAARFRSSIWKSSGRLNAYVTRPKDVKPWSPEQRNSFIEAFREAWGADGKSAGKMPLLEDGMEIKPYSFNAKEAQYAEAKQLAREDVAAAYRINPALVWHTGTQTYASARDNARALYSECLSPDFQMIQQRINADLFPKIGADPSLYCEFDVSEKVQGTFEERVSTVQSAVGAPWMLRDEARALFNMPHVDGGDELVTPLNVLEGGLASPRDAGKSRTMSKSGRERRLRIKGKPSASEVDEVADALSRFAERQQKSVMSRLGAKSSDWFDIDRWDEELADDLAPIMVEIADTHGSGTAAEIGSSYDKERTRKYLRRVAETRAHMANAALEKRIEAAIEDGGDIEEAFEHSKNAGAKSMGLAIATSVAGWSLVEAVNQARYDGDAPQSGVYKVWIHNGGATSSRISHAAMDGETVPIDSTFSNGAMWPGDDSLDASETCYCHCETEVIVNF